VFGQRSAVDEFPLRNIAAEIERATLATREGLEQ
jgi:hypothetical protein